MAAEGGVGTALGDKFCMSASFNDTTVIEKNDLVGLTDGGKAMGDDECGAIFHEIG